MIELWFAFWAAFMLVMAAFLYRNSLTLKARLYILDKSGGIANGLRRYNLLPTYDQMLGHPAYWGKWTVKDWVEYVDRKEQA